MLSWGFNFGPATLKCRGDGSYSPGSQPHLTRDSCCIPTGSSESIPKSSRVPGREPRPPLRGPGGSLGPKHTPVSIHAPVGFSPRVSWPPKRNWPFPPFDSPRTCHHGPPEVGPWSGQAISNQPTSPRRVGGRYPPHSFPLLDEFVPTPTLSH